MTVIDWLLDSDPAIRWQVMRNLLHGPAEDVGVERAKVATEGWGARLLALQGPDGRWAGDKAFFSLFTSTHWSLHILRELGLEPQSQEAQRAVSLVREKDVRFEYDDEPYFEGEVEPCINASVVAIGSYFGQDVQPEPRFKVLFSPTPRRLYDILRAFEYFSAARVKPDERMTEAFELLLSKRDADGQWPVEYEYEGGTAGSCRARYGPDSATSLCRCR